MTRTAAARTFLLFASLVTGCTATDRYAGMPGLGEYDRTFMARAYEAALASAAAGDVADRRGHDPAVRLLGRDLAADERQRMQDLYDLSQDKGMPLPNAPAHDGQAMVAVLDDAPDADFDRTFLTTAGAWQGRELRLYDAARATATDPDVRALAARNWANAHARLTAFQTMTSHD